MIVRRAKKPRCRAQHDLGRARYAQGLHARPRPGAWVEGEVHEVRDEVRREDRQRDDEEDALNERIVLVLDRVQAEVTHAGVVEDQFHQ